MRLLHVLIALAIAFIWGSNFVAIKLSYLAFKPFAMAFWRFTLSTFPWIFFIPKPNLPWSLIIKIALFMWVGQLGFLFLGMYLGAEPGIASLMMQSHSLFTILWTVLFFNYKLHKGEIAGIACAVLGILLIASEHVGGGSMVGYALLIPSAISVSIANILFGKAGSSKNDHPLALVVWSSLFTILPMFLISYFTEGPSAVWDGVLALNWPAGISMGYTVYFSTLIATALWTYLMQHHSPSVVVPFTLLVPICAMGSSAFIMDEQFSPLAIGASVLIIVGLAINQMTKRHLYQKSIKALR